MCASDPVGVEAAGAQRPARARLLLLVLLVIGFGFLLREGGTRLGRRAAPAGLGQGLLQGALMPCALPTLALGYDVNIYAANNNGVPYKLGYALGVNLCGAVFFGSVFWRWRRWRRRAASPGVTPPCPSGRVNS